MQFSKKVVSFKYHNYTENSFMCDNSIQIATDKKNEQLKQIKKQNKFRQKLHKKW